MVEAVMFSLVLVCTKNGLFPYLIGLSRIADLQLTTFLSNRGFILTYFFSSSTSSSSSSSEDKLTESSVFQDPYDSVSPSTIIILSYSFSSLSSYLTNLFKKYFQFYVHVQTDGTADTVEDEFWFS